MLFINTADAKIGKKEKFSILYQKYYRYSYKIAFGILKNDRYIDDVVQEIFMKLWKNIDKINMDDEEGTKAYISVAARTTAINRYNKDKKVGTKFVEINDDVLFATTSDETADPADIVANNANVDYIYGKIKELGKNYDQVMMLKYKHEHTPEEIAEVTGLNIKTIYTKLSRGREILKGKLLEERRKRNEK